MEQLQEENLSEKPWFLKGEITSAQRPQNSALEEHLEYDIAVRQSEFLDVRMWLLVCLSFAPSYHLLVLFLGSFLLIGGVAAVEIGLLGCKTKCPS